MEKSAAEYRKLRTGLLILALMLFSAACLHAAPSSEYMRSLRLKPVQNYFFTSSDNTYYVEIANCRPDDVDFFVNDLPDGVSFVSSSKTSVLMKDKNGTDVRGTRLELTYRFYQNGTFLLPKMLVQVQGWTYYINFERVSVFENPRLVQPVLTIDFSNPDFDEASRTPFEIKAGDTVRFTIYIRYAAQISHFSWNIPEDSLFKEVKRFEMAGEGYHITEFTPDLIPVATFDWQPLMAKKYSLPSVSVTAISYNGGETELKYPDYIFNVHEASAESIGEKSEDEEMFAYAFTSTAEEASGETTAEATKEILNRITELRRQERHSFFRLHSIRKERKSLEASIGLTLTEDEESLIVFVVLLVLCVVSFVSSIVFYALKKGRYGTLLISLFCLLTVFCVIHGVKLNKTYSVYQGGSIYPIPEDTVPSSGLIIPNGGRVLVVYSVGNWAYIQYNDISGWMKTDGIYLIK